MGWVQRRTSDIRLQSSHQDGSKIKLLPIGERPGSILVPQTPLTPGFIPTTGTPLRFDSTTISTLPPAISPIIHFLAGPETPIESPDFLDSMLAPMPPATFSRQRSGGAPDPIAVIRESKDISDFNITVSPEGGSSEGNTPTTGSGHQTFPETPHAFSPLWSASTAGGSPLGMYMPSLSVTSALVFVPGHSPRSASLSGGMPAYQPSLAQKVLLSRAITVTGNKPTSKLHTVGESSGQASLLSSSSENSPSDKFVENDFAVQPSALPELPPPQSPVVAPFSPAQAHNSESSPQIIPAALPDASQTLSSPASASSFVLPTPPTSPPDNPKLHPSPPSTSVLSVSSTATPEADDLPVVQTSIAHRQRFPSEVNHPPSPLSVAPPPYHTVVNDERSSNFHQHIGIPPPVNESASIRPPGGIRRARVRPPLPIGPRKLTTGQLVPGSVRDRNGSVSSVGSSAMSGSVSASSGSISLHKLLAQASSPKFYTPAPKYRGYTMEAAKWTFTSEQLQTIVSRAIKQSAEASSVRLLRLETLDIDIPEEVHRLEMQNMDSKMKYRSLTRQRLTLLGSLAANVDGSEGVNSAIALQTLEELAEVSASLDHLAEDIHSITHQLANLKSLGDVHSASALAMALRKLNASFLKQVAETQVLRQQVSSLEAERDEAWTQAEGVAQEYDELVDRYRGDFQIPRTPTSSRRSSRISAVRKSSIRVSKAGLRSASMRSSVSSSRHRHRSSESMQPSSAADIPPVPPMPYASSLGISTADLPSRSSIGTHPFSQFAVRLSS